MKKPQAYYLSGIDPADQNATPSAVGIFVRDEAGMIRTEYLSKPITNEEFKSEIKRISKYYRLPKL